MCCEVVIYKYLYSFTPLFLFIDVLSDGKVLSFRQAEKISINKDNKNIFIHFQLYLYPLMFLSDGKVLSSRQVEKISINKNNKNIFIHFQLYLYPLMFYRMGRYCLPDSCFLLVCDPETSSRVTLTLLGTGFQPDLLFGCLVV